MLRRILITSSILSIAASFSMASGCSSSSGNGTGGGSGSSSGGTADASEDSSGGSSGGSGSSSGGADSGSSSGSSGGSSSGGGSGSSSGSTSTCPASADAAAFTAPTYVAAVAHQGVCQTADISAFVTACVAAGATQAGCTAWIQANVAGAMPDGGGAGNACGNCIFSPQNNGATWLDPNNYFGPNYAGCIQITDSTNGTACATAWNNFNGCDGDYCDIYQSAGATQYQCCGTLVNGTGGMCSSYNTTFGTACKSDLQADAGGAALTCFPGTGATQQATDMTYIATLICGGAGG